MRATTLGLRVLLPLCLVPALAGCGPRQPREPQSVVLIVIDTLRQDRLGVYGYARDTSPNLDALAARGAAADGLSPTCWTKPATGSILTGLHPLRHGATGRRDLLPESVVTLAEAFQAKGYQTFGMSANGWVSKTWGFDQGFGDFFYMGDIGYSHVATSEEIHRELLPRLASLRPPFFLYVHYIDPHVPYAPPIAWDGSPLPEDLAKRVPMDNDALSPLDFIDRDQELVRAASDLYDGEVRWVDRHVGELLARLDELGLMASTLTVVTADHGEEFEDHQRMGHGHTLYEELTRVPLIFVAPGQIEPGTRLGTLSLMDIFPTLLDLAGAGGELPYEVDGLDQADVLRGEALLDEDRDFLLHVDHFTGHGLALVHGSRKLLLGRYPYVKAVFDVAGDRREQHNLLLGGESLDAGLAGRLAREYNELRRHAFVQQSVEEVEASNLEALRALGYISKTKSEDRPEFTLIPSRILPADPLADGLLGWQRKEIASCVEPGRLESENQLLRGWYMGKRPVGRWTSPEASVALGVPAGARLGLRLRGINFRGRPFRMLIAVDGKDVLNLEIQDRDYEVLAPIEAPAGKVAVVGLRSEPPLGPRELASQDPRVLGTFLERICLEPNDPEGAR